MQRVEGFGLPASGDRSARTGSASHGPCVAVDGVGVNLQTLESTCAEVLRNVRSRQGFTLFTLNLDHLTKLRTDAAFRSVYARATYVSADGWPVVWFAKLQGAALERTSGADLVDPLCEAAAVEGVSIYLIGPGKVSQEKAISRLSDRYPDVRIAGSETPLVKSATSSEIEEEIRIDEIAARINASGAALCFVALGAPKQEIVADLLASRCGSVGFLCVGAAMDFISGAARRAPNWMRRYNLEWLWRVGIDPRRLALRYLGCGYMFGLLLAETAVAHRARGRPIAAGDPGA
jgi:exopolysaccharide biosynthesis WecB/TagA/CpsF family protein